jgi:hypothetical protein
MAERIAVVDLEGTPCLHGGSMIQVNERGGEPKRAIYPVLSLWRLLHQVSGSPKPGRSTANCR